MDDRIIESLGLELNELKEKNKELEEAILFNNSELINLRKEKQISKSAYLNLSNSYNDLLEDYNKLKDDFLNIILGIKTQCPDLENKRNYATLEKFLIKVENSYIKLREKNGKENTHKG